MDWRVAERDRRSVGDSQAQPTNAIMSRIRFEVLPPVQTKDEPILVTGGHPDLGNWNPSRGLRLQPMEGSPWLVGEIEAEEGSTLEFKFTRGSWQTEAVDAWGHVPLNHRHDVWLDATIHRVVADWKDRYAGRLTRDRIYSRVLASYRDLLVWLPPSYPLEIGRRFPVIYLHDGDNIFDPETSPVSRVDWAADEWVRLLSLEGAMQECIIVAVCHPEGFTEDNFDFRDVDLSPERGGAAYAQFIARELVGYIDSHYHTQARSEARVLGGSSLGALNGFYTALHHPGIFTKYICLSTAFEDLSDSLPQDASQLLALENEPALPHNVKMYFDYGTVGLDECYEPYHRELDALLHAKGWKEGQNFRIVRVPGGSHDELSWRLRFGDALRFLFS